MAYGTRYSEMCDYHSIGIISYEMLIKKAARGYFYYPKGYRSEDIPGNTLPDKLTEKDGKPFLSFIYFLSFLLQ